MHADEQKISAVEGGRSRCQSQVLKESGPAPQIISSHFLVLLAASPPPRPINPAAPSTSTSNQIRPSVETPFCSLAIHSDSTNWTNALSVPLPWPLPVDDGPDDKLSSAATGRVCDSPNRPPSLPKRQTAQAPPAPPHGTVPRAAQSRRRRVSAPVNKSLSLLTRRRQIDNVCRWQLKHLAHSYESHQLTRSSQKPKRPSAAA
ncbi:hypothetical protein G7Z17_g11629 [Cylindrodendrum hubeiense]|uniref:Uncharacterized protein n=1 Tax=Cylindrodendrum hubeiense TaxID=595255 RepID=A0A9P5LA21_9HYPO|nr:hypothetical protein G7Z17_g11629 [Cylindrodendrum hubeiense]